MKRPAAATPPKTPKSMKRPKDEKGEEEAGTPEEIEGNPLEAIEDKNNKEADAASGSPSKEEDKKNKEDEEEEGKKKDKEKKNTPKVSKRPALKPKGKAKSSAKAKSVMKKIAKDKNGEKDKKTEDDPEDPKKKEKKTLKAKTDSWQVALGSKKNTGEESEQELDPNEPRDRQKAQKYSKLEKEGALPKEVTEAMEAAGKSANPRAAKTQLINRLFRKEGKGFVMIPKDPAFQKLQKHLDVKFGKEQATSTLAYTKHTFSLQ